MRGAARQSAQAVDGLAHGHARRLPREDAAHDDQRLAARVELGGGDRARLLVKGSGSGLGLG